VGYVRRVARRDDGGADAAPTALQTALKDHQKAGLDWLQETWRGGAPGVLLADDMGLGKTLQALAFLEWLRRVQGRAGDHRPFLVVAPTSLLETWVMEHDHHLQPPGLGEPLKVWGRGLAALRTNGGRGSALDRSRLAHASWLLTTYETLRDYHQSLAVVPFAAAIFDEVQKIKNPGALATEAAKAINADFVIGLSGTPVENRLADLWSIFDRVHEGFLGDLKAFSSRYERPDTPQESLIELKAKIERPLNGLPPPMLRRMKHEHLPGLPPKTERVRARPMPEVQAQAYGRAIEVARGQARGDVLRALHGIRSVSLHPLGADEATDGRFITASARWQVTFEILHEIAGQGEKVLIFLEAIELQPVLAALIQKTFGLERQPMIINGQLAGAQRQQRVNAFQNGAAGFDAMILGPRAAGIGLTLTAATHVIHLSRWWNPAVEDQCTDRVYRIGQHKPVTVHIPQALWPESEASSFDRRLHELLERKRALSRDLLAPPAATAADARDLFTATVGRDDN
jgi:SNF2 family DNA or RNA helicase